MAIELRVTSGYPHHTHSLWFIDRQKKLRVRLAERAHKRNRSDLVKIARRVMEAIGGRWYDRMDIYEVNNKPHAIKLD